ncbi:hypothetical protein [Sporosarcina sp. BP05]|uniref:hypothetical protein n=1 Tax=Sporosarcina sp. BP05 TaxID=2758726 RepID=UPI0016455C8A|nr:hypothetical protein [Sporosarcina sp. BP05]
MKNALLILLLLFLSVVLTACENESQELEKKEELNHVVKPESIQEVEGPIIVLENEQNLLPTFQSIASPSISLLSSNGDVIFPSFDHSYGDVCWNDCDEFYHYNYPTIHSGDVVAGNQLQIDWSTLKPQPTEIHFIHIDNRDDYDKKELSREQKTPENTPLKITIDEEIIGSQYALEFIWIDGGSVKGKSIINFKLE